EARGVTRLGVAAPYTEGLIDALGRYWADRGVAVVARHRIITRTDDTETIYQLSSADAAAGLSAMSGGDFDALLLSGTGMPSLAALRGAPAEPPVFSSNLCLAWRLLMLVGADRHLDRHPPEIAGWRQRMPPLSPLGSVESA
ncbi:MAG: hypothetical protein MI723_18865, partial [Caulobacterales bacterium]|nr:hypothetical protein [Caulobacterales bacterium]